MFIDGPGTDCAAAEEAAKIGANAIAKVLRRGRLSRHVRRGEWVFFTRNKRVERLPIIFLVLNSHGTVDAPTRVAWIREVLG
jgi:hypothetical protein